MIRDDLRLDEIPKKLKATNRLEEDKRSRQLTKSKTRKSKETIPRNPPPSPAQSLGTPTRDEEPMDFSPTTQPNLYRAYHSSDEASDPEGYELSTGVKPQQQLVTEQCTTDSHLSGCGPADVSAAVESRDLDETDEDVELSVEEELRLQEEIELRRKHLKKWAGIRKRAEKKAMEKKSENGASF